MKDLKLEEILKKIDQAKQGNHEEIDQKWIDDVVQLANGESEEITPEEKNEIDEIVQLANEEV